MLKDISMNIMMIILKLFIVCVCVCDFVYS